MVLMVIVWMVIMIVLMVALMIALMEIGMIAVMIPVIVMIVKASGHSDEQSQGDRSPEDYFEQREAIHVAAPFPDRSIRFGPSPLPTTQQKSRCGRNHGHWGSSASAYSATSHPANRSAIYLIFRQNVFTFSTNNPSMTSKRGYTCNATRFSCRLKKPIDRAPDSEKFCFLVSRNSAGSARVNSTTSSPVVVLMS
jgi:hypothetical protein